ncbi:MAG: hypothetical protein PHT27_07175 [Candidatus Izemoplasmatales bacterium]|nr:hypothetical protein [Candidatus Izemoplasmatales bacterium]
MMKKAFIVFLAFCIGLAVLSAAEEKKEDEKKDSSKDKTSPVSGLTTLKDLTPSKIEELKNKDVSFETTFKYLEGELPDYFIKNGKKTEKYFLLRVEPENLAVLCKKKSDFDELITSLKKFDKILISGKIKKFTFLPHSRKSRAYYLEVEKIEFLKSSEDNLEAKEKYLKKKLREIENRKRQNSLKNK